MKNITFTHEYTQKDTKISFMCFGVCRCDKNFKYIILVILRT